MQFVKICAKHETFIQLGPDEAFPDPRPRCQVCEGEYDRVEERKLEETGMFPIRLPVPPDDPIPPHDPNDPEKLPRILAHHKQREHLHAAGCPTHVPWSKLLKHPHHLATIHGESLGAIARKRGGLGIAELIHLLEGPAWKAYHGKSDLELLPRLLELLAADAAG